MEMKEIEKQLYVQVSGIEEIHNVVVKRIATQVYWPTRLYVNQESNTIWAQIYGRIMGLLEEHEKQLMSNQYLCMYYPIRRYPGRRT